MCPGFIRGSQIILKPSSVALLQKNTSSPINSSGFDPSEVENQGYPIFSKTSKLTAANPSPPDST
jgi:hypothetical protein